MIFAPVFVKNRKKYDNFLQFFLVVYQLVRRKLKKKLLKTLDKILKCRIFAACLRLNRNNKKQITITLKTKRNEKQN